MEQYFGMKSYTYANGKITAKQLHHDMYQWANGSGAYYDGKFHIVSRSYTYLYCNISSTDGNCSATRSTIQNFSALLPPIVITTPQRV